MSAGARGSRSVKLQYFAVLREQRGVAEETLETTARTSSDLYEELRARHGFTLPAARLRVAINDSFVPWDRELADGDRVAFIPPVAGG
jgi:molybdopterin converting factor subunit 1